MTFLLQMLSALMEPIGVLGYVLCGLFLPRLWLALPAAVAWAAVMQVWESAQARAQQGLSGLELMFPRIAVALLVSLAAFLALRAWRNARAERPFDRPVTRL